MVKKKLKAVLDIKQNKTLISNFLFLSVLQGLNLLLPLLTVPYLNRVIGIEKVGLLAIAIAICNYFQVFTDYGFNLTATKDISQNVDNKQKVNAIYSDVMTSKLILLLISAIVFTIIVLNIDVFYKERQVYFLTFGMVAGYSIFPVWFFQGMQKMKYITYLNVFSKVLFTIAIFIFVKQKQDYWLVPLFTSLGFIISGLLSLFYIRKSFNIKYSVTSVSKIKSQLFMGRYVFLSQLKITLFSNTNTLVLGLIGGDAAAGYFSNAEKIIRALAGFQIPVVNTLFPYVSKLITESKAEAYRKINNTALAGTAIYIIIIAIIFVLSHQIVTIVFGEQMENTALILRILLPIPVFIFLNNLYGTQILLNLNKDRLFFNVLLVAACLNLTLIFPLTYYYNFSGTAISVFTTELFLCIAMYYYAIREKNK